MSENRCIDGISEWLVKNTDFGPLLTDFQQSFNRLPQLPASVLPLCKIRMAQLHGVQVDSNTGALNAERVDAVAQWPANEQFSLVEKACLAYTEVYAMDVHAITDAHSDAVKLHVGEPGLVALVQALGVFYAQTRLAKLWGFSECLEQPEHTQ